MNDTIIHSDQGSSYTSYDYRDYLLSLGVKQSCSDVGECWDNAAMESFNAILKTEGFYAKWTKKVFRACKIPSQDVFEQLETRYTLCQFRLYILKLLPIKRILYI